MASRRTHTKSRNGCSDCKRRKVKCDESYPTCFNCARHGNLCSLADSQGRQSSHSTSSATAATEVARDSADHFMHLKITSDGIRTPLGYSGGHEMELMHHYSISTCNTFALREDVRHVWRVVIPQEGYSHPFVMHGLLALTALHKSFLIPSQRQTYLDISNYHQALGLEGFTPRLNNINRDNWRPIFSFASIVIIYVCLLPARSENQKIPAPITSVLELFTVVRGIQSILTPVLPDLRSTNFAPLSYVFIAAEDGRRESDPPLDQTYLPKDVFQALQRLGSTIERDMKSPAVEDYLQAVKKLEHVARLIAHAGLHIEGGIIMFWLYAIPDRILVDIRALSPLALLLLSYFCVFLTIMEGQFWLFRGWAERLMTEIDVHLAHHSHLSGLLKWPKDIVFRTRISDGVL